MHHMSCTIHPDVSITHTRTPTASAAGWRAPLGLQRTATAPGAHCRQCKRVERKSLLLADRGTRLAVNKQGQLPKLAESPGQQDRHFGTLLWQDRQLQHSVAMQHICRTKRAPTTPLGAAVATPVTPCKEGSDPPHQLNTTYMHDITDPGSTASKTATPYPPSVGLHCDDYMT